VVNAGPFLNFAGFAFGSAERVLCQTFANLYPLVRCDRSTLWYGFAERAVDALRRNVVPVIHPRFWKGARHGPAENGLSAQHCRRCL